MMTVSVLLMLSVPRASGGDPIAIEGGSDAYVLFPAQAGVILAPLYWWKEFDTVPRASGGDPNFARYCYVQRICSPRKRG